MTCPKCNSENVKVETKKSKNTIIPALILLLGGGGLAAWGTVGCIIGALIGLVIGAITKAAMQNKYEAVVVCQECGNVAIIKQK